MNKIRRIMIVGAGALGVGVLMFMALCAVDPAFAQATTKTLATNFTLINFGTTTATVSVNYVKPDGSTWAADAGNTNFTIGPNGGQKIVRQYQDTTLTAGQGSAVVSSDQALGAVTQVLADYPTHPAQNASNGAYSGITTPSDTWLLPLVAKNGSSASGTLNTQIVIQNAGSAAVNVQVAFSNNYTKTGISLNPGASLNYDLSLDGSMPTGFASAVVKTVPAGGSLAVVQNTFIGADGLQTLDGFASANVGSSWMVPLFVAKLASNNLSTPVTIQNLSGGTLAINQITMSCVADPASPTAGNFSVQNSTTVANNASYIFNPVLVSWTTPVNWFGACRITTSPAANVVSYVQMRFVGIQNTDSYQAINASGSNKHVFVPLIAKRLTNGFASAATIVNLSNSNTANVSLVYTKSSGPGPATLTWNTTIPANGSLIQNQRLAGFQVNGTPMPDQWVGTLTVASDQPIDGFVQLTNILNPAGDTFMTHNVFTTP